ncbi:hypothetical protein RHMOL_Rhmol11G0021900 [Rhododendron molle]|uniref:Uncharacterized protein n=1 Tax=Rhododendron molle TaxID=49168 RepID=A0ACC0LN26_RHOML|nr:hypothetical protein RHMOL_Rhmol11G0021900 [Rhododendron molle]
MITGGSSSGVSGSGCGNGGGNREPSPTRDSAKGKALAVTEKKTIEVLVEQVEFKHAAGSLRHMPITRGNFTKFVDEAVLDQLLWENTTIVSAVLAAQEDRQTAIELA